MRLKVLFFAELRVKMNREFIDSDFPGVRNIRELQEKLEEDYEELTGCFSEYKSVKTAVNHEYCSSETILCDGDEVAFFPPVTGG